MNFDLRTPIGMLFSLFGLILTGYGLATNGDTALYAKSLGINMNLWWGIVMLIFGIVMLLLAKFGKKA